METNDMGQEQFSIMAIFTKNSHYLPSKLDVAVQIFLFSISIIFTCVGVYTAFRFTIFHKNQRNILVALLLFWFELLLSRLLVWRFKYLLEFYEGENRPLDECSDFGRCSLHINCLDAIFIAAICRYHYMYLAVSTPLAITTERIFATIFIKDYEKKSRYWIFVLIFSVQNISAYALAIYTTTEDLSFTVLIIGVCVTISFSGFLYCLVEMFNRQKLLILEKHHRDAKYSLSIRYQLKENLKSLKLLRRFFLSIMGFIVVMGLANSIPVILSFSEEVILLTRQYLDYIFHANPLIMIITGFVTIETYRTFAVNKARAVFGLRPESQKVNIRKFCPPENVAESDVYFGIFEQQLNNEKTLARGSSNRKSRK